MWLEIYFVNGNSHVQIATFIFYFGTDVTYIPILHLFAINISVLCCSALLSSDDSFRSVNSDPKPADLHVFKYMRTIAIIQVLVDFRTRVTHTAQTSQCFVTEVKKAVEFGLGSTFAWILCDMLNTLATWAVLFVWTWLCTWQMVSTYSAFLPVPSAQSAFTIKDSLTHSQSHSHTVHTDTVNVTVK